MGCLGQRGGTKWMLGWCTYTCICCCVSQNAFVKEREYTLRVFINNWNNTVGIGYNIQAKLDREVSTEFRGYSRDKHGRLEAHHEQVEHLFLTIEETDLVQDHRQRVQVMRNPWHKLWDNRWPIRTAYGTYGRTAARTRLWWATTCTRLCLPTASTRLWLPTARTRLWCSSSWLPGQAGRPAGADGIQSVPRTHSATTIQLIVS